MMDHACQMYLRQVTGALPVGQAAGRRRHLEWSSSHYSPPRLQTTWARRNSAVLRQPLSGHATGRNRPAAAYASSPPGAPQVDDPTAPPPPPPRSDPRIVREPPKKSGETTATFHSLLLQLRNGPDFGGGGETLQLDPALGARERRAAHILAERLGLAHTSVGTGAARRFTARRLTVADRLGRLRELLDEEEAAVRAAEGPGVASQSWRALEAQGLLLHRASVLERESSAFGRERWVFGDGVGVERAGHVARFAQRARPGGAVRLADKAAGVAGSHDSWRPSESQPPGRVAWARGGKLCVVFDYSPDLGGTDGSEGFDLMLVPDSVTFDRMRSAISECERCDAGGFMAHLLESLLGTRLVLGTPLQKDGDKIWAAGSEGPGVCLDGNLNEEQRRGAQLCASGSADGQNAAVAVLHGPFGTGKTRTLVEVVRRRVRAGERVLVCASSNAAVDNMAAALLAADPTLPLARAGLAERVSSGLAAHTLEALQESLPQSSLAADLRKQAYAAKNAASRWTRASDGGARRREAQKEANALFRDARRLERAAAIEVLRRTRVLCGTLTGFASALLDIGKGESKEEDELGKFDCVVVDEASQAVTPALLLTLPFLRDRRQVGGPSFILAGDHRQLPPTVISEDPHGGGLASTLFEELIERDGGGLGSTWAMDGGDSNQWTEERTRILTAAASVASGSAPAATDAGAVSDDTASPPGGRISSSLRVQYRMPAALMAFPSAAFYGASLIAHGRTANLSPPPRGEVGGNESRPLLVLRRGCAFEVIDTAGAGFDEERSSAYAAPPGSRRGTPASSESLSCANPGQADLVARAVRELCDAALLSPAEVGVVAPYSAQVMLLRDILAKEVEAGLEIDSVDGFQGREKEAIVVDCVRSNGEGSVGFLADRRRLNVAITRAIRKLVVVIDSATLGSDPVWATFVDWATSYENPSSSICTTSGGSGGGGGLAYRSFFEIPPEGGW